MKGKIIRLLDQKNFGFIRGEDNQEYFFHRQDFNGFYDDLVVDIRTEHTIPVTFDIAQSERGPRASNVTRTDVTV